MSGRLWYIKVFCCQRDHGDRYLKSTHYNNTSYEEDCCYFIIVQLKTPILNISIGAIQ
jgi:hypothetical protein